MSDRLAIRDLVETYASLVDRADAAGVARLFTLDGVLELWMDPARDEPTAIRHGSAEIEAALKGLADYDATHHTISSVSIVVDGEAAAGETRCEAHHLKNGHDQVLYLHYLDRFRKTSDGWHFARRELHLRWVNVVPVIASRDADPSPVPASDH